MPIFPSMKLALVHIPKTGGTSIARTLAAHTGEQPLFYAEGFDPKREGLTHSPQHFSFEELRSAGLIPLDYKVLAVVRDPYDRFASEYNWRVSHGHASRSQDAFADQLFQGGYWDQHEKPQRHFLRGGEGKVTLLRQEALVEQFYKMFGIRLLHENASDGPKEVSPRARKMVEAYWSEDFSLGYSKR